MSVSLPELLPGLAMFDDRTAIGKLQVPVKWGTIGFECEIKTLGSPLEMADRALVGVEPVRLRVNKAENDSCRVEIFCAAARLCGASAGC